MSSKSGILILSRFSGSALARAFGYDEALAWNTYYQSALERTVGSELGKKVVERVTTDGLDYSILSDDEATALDIVLVSLFSPEHKDTLFPVMDAEIVDDIPIPVMRHLLERAEERGSEGHLRAVMEGRRFETDEPPDGWAYATFDPRESRALAAHIRSLLASGGFSRAHTRDAEKRLLPVLDEVAENDEWLMVDGQPTECPRRALRAATVIPKGSLRAADYEILVQRRPAEAVEILEALLPKTKGDETKKVLDRLVTATRMLGRADDQASWERRRAEHLAKPAR